MTFVAPIGNVPRVIAVPLSATTVAPIALGIEPFMPADRVMALSAGAGQIFGAVSPAGDSTRSLKFIVAGADINSAASTLGQGAAARVGTTKVTGDLTITLGTVAGPLAIGILPLNATNTAAEMLGAIVKVNGVVWGRITDATAPNPAALQWGLDSDTEIGTRLVLGADTTNYIPVGAEVEILRPNLALTGLVSNHLAKPVARAGAALVAGVAEERNLGVPITVTDTAGRSSNRLAQVAFLAADVAAVTLVGLK